MRCVVGFCLLAVLCCPSMSSMPLNTLTDAIIRPRTATAAHPLCLRLRGGKLKYKDLKVVKQTREREEGRKVKGEHRPPKPKHRAGSRVRERLANATSAMQPEGRSERASGGSATQSIPEKKVRGGKKARRKKMLGDETSVEQDALEVAAAKGLCRGGWAALLLGDSIHVYTFLL
jgi:hypothetical protein